MHASPAIFPAALQQLDGQRIAGTSLAIALHVAVAMVLFMPVQQVIAPVEEFSTLIMTVPPKPIPDPPKPPKPDAPRTPITHQAPAPPIAPVTPPDFITDTPPQIGLPIVPPIDIGDPPPFASGFVDLQADMAPAPVYPGQAISRNQEGRVVLRVLVDERGRPAQVAIEQSSGFRLLDEAALKIVRTRWHFIPAQSAGTAVSAWALVPIVFQLDR